MKRRVYDASFFCPRTVGKGAVSRVFRSGRGENAAFQGVVRARLQRGYAAEKREEEGGGLSRPEAEHMEGLPEYEGGDVEDSDDEDNRRTGGDIEPVARRDSNP